MNIGAQIKKIRMQQKRTQQEVADLCGFTKGLLSKIENGRVVPPIATLSKLSNALGVNISALLEENGVLTVAYAQDAYLNPSLFTATDKGYSIYPLAAGYTNKKMQPVLILAKKGKVKKHSLSHTGEEFVYVIQGKVKFRIENTDYFLSQGESLYFDSHQHHGMEVITEEAHYLNIFV